MDSTAEQRSGTIDILKGIGILLIVLGHCEPGTLLMRLLYSIHLFVFFFCSGYLGYRYEKRNFRIGIRANFNRLLVPYIFWSVLSQIIAIIIDGISVKEFADNIMFFNGSVGWNAPLWFLVSLFWTDSICLILVLTRKLHLQVLVLFIMVAAWVYIARGSIVVPFGMYTVPVSSVFWLFGYFAKKYDAYIELTIMIKNRLCFVCVMIGSLLIYIFCGVFFNDVISIYHNHYNNLVLTLFAAIFGIIFLVMLSSIVTGRLADLFKKFGKHTMLILCTHYYILRLIGDTSKALIGYNLWRETSTLKSIILAIFVLSFYCLIFGFVDKIKTKNTIIKKIL